MKRIRHYPEKNKQRWVAYFDLLGARSWNEKGLFEAFNNYAAAVERAKQQIEYEPNIQVTCFSDSFIFYTEDDSAKEFRGIDEVARWFAYFLITSARIPLRGAISVGPFYADRDESLYFGPALNEAHAYGESQNWVGFMLAPSAVEQLERLKLPIRERLNYTYWSVPLKKMAWVEARHPACILGNWIQVGTRNPCLDALVEMRARFSDFEPKYSNAIKFIEESQRVYGFPK